MDMKKNKEKALRLSRIGSFQKLTKRQKREIAEDYRDYLTHYLRLHLSKDDFDRIVSTPYTAWEYDSDNEPVKKIGYYYHDVLEELRKAAQFLCPQFRLRFFLDEYRDVAKSTDRTAMSDAYNIYSFAEGWGMEVLRNFFYDYATNDFIENMDIDSEDKEICTKEDTDGIETVYEDPVDLAWKDDRFEKYLDAYAEANPERLRRNPWDSIELGQSFWPWRDRLSWYRQKCKSAVIRVYEQPLTDKERELYRIVIWDQNVPAFVDNEKILFTKDIDDFQKRWFCLGVYEGIERAFLAAKEGKGDMLCKGVAHIYADKTFLVEDAWFSAINWFGHHRKFHVNHWEFSVQWISFHSSDSKETEYFRIISHRAEGVCQIEIFPRLLTAVEECNGNSLLECHAPFSPSYSMKIPRNRWQRTSFEDFSDNYIRSICFMSDEIFDGEESLQTDIKDFTITTEVMREFFEEV